MSWVGNLEILQISQVVMMICVVIDSLAQTLHTLFKPFYEGIKDLFESSPTGNISFP